MITYIIKHNKNIIPIIRQLYMLQLQIIQLYNTEKILEDSKTDNVIT